MRSSLISRSRFLSSTSLGIVAALAATPLGLLAGCGDDACGPGDAPAVGLTAASADVTLTYGNLSSLAGNDCPAADAPAGVVSLSIEGTQDGGPGLITLCVPRPDLLVEGNRTLGTSLSMADVRIFDLSGEADGCTFALDSSRPPTGTAVGLGVCGNGADPAGFALELDGALSLRRTCGATLDSVAVTLTGRVAVSSRD